MKKPNRSCRCKKTRKWIMKLRLYSPVCIKLNKGLIKCYFWFLPLFIVHVCFESLINVLCISYFAVLFIFHNFVYSWLSSFLSQLVWDCDNQVELSTGNEFVLSSTKLIKISVCRQLEHTNRREICNTASLERTTAFCLRFTLKNWFVKIC